jgi:hypothetical protein
MIKFMKPKRVREKRCNVEKNAERNQYEEKYFFKGVALRMIEKRQTYTKLAGTYYINDDLSYCLN